MKCAILGDCMYIPYRWYHQVNSWADDKSMSFAVNIWWGHQLPDQPHVPQNCKLSPEEATLDKYAWDFTGMDELGNGRMMNHFFEYTDVLDDIRYQEFVEALKVRTALLLDMSSFLRRGVRVSCS